MTGAMTTVQPEEGILPGGLPFRALGAGEPLVYLPPFAPYNNLPTGLSRSIEVRIQRGLAAPGFRVFQVNRRPGLPAGTSMENLAGELASTLAATFARPVDVLGFSTGGALGLTLAANHPDRVRRLVVASAAHRMSSVARAACAAAAARAAAHDRRGFQAAMAPTATLSPIGRRLAAAFGWLVAPLFLGREWDPADAVITLRADLELDLSARLSDIRAPALIICGDSDPSYPEALTAELARGIPLCQRIVYPRTGHGVILARRFAADMAAFLLRP